MSVIRLSAFFKDDDGHGWSETHDKDGGVGVIALTAFLTNFNTLMQTYRRPLLSGDSFYLGCRASYPTASGAIAGDNLLLDPPMRGPQSSGGVAVWMGAPEVSVKMRFRNDASTARSDVYIRGQWNQLITAGVLDFGTVLGMEWKSRADQLAAALIQGGYGWQGTDPAATSRGNVISYAENLDGTVTLTIEVKNGVAMPAVGTKLDVKYARINDSQSVLNRSLVSEVLAGGVTLKTQERIAVSPFLTSGTYVATVTRFIPYAALSYYKLGKRKTGRVFGVGPGRLPAKTLH